MNEYKSIVIGILAHVDAGKTTLSEALLYDCGTTTKIGRVDHGDAFLDTYIQERERGITIFAKQAELSLPGSDGKSTSATLIDTPGHVDFTAEAERTLGILDYAILVINGRDGVQQHTRTLVRMLNECRIPYFVWINKTDIAGVDVAETVTELKAEICENIVVFNDNGSFEDDCAVCDEKLLDEMLEKGKLSKDSIADAVKSLKLIPCYSGSALKNTGVDKLIEGLADYTIGYTEKDAECEFSARVFKITHDSRGTRLTHIKVTSGKIKVKDIIEEEKVNNIRLYNGDKFTAIDEARAGMVVAVTGLTNSRAGQIIGDRNGLLSGGFALGKMYRIIYPGGTDPYKFLGQLSELEEELPELQLYMTEEKEFLVRLVGSVQIDVLKEIIAGRYNVDVDFEEYVPMATYEEEPEEIIEIDDRPDLNARWEGGVDKSGRRMRAAGDSEETSDADLKRIFEMTYGVEKKQIIHPARIIDPARTVIKKQEILPEYLLVDGYNVIFAWEDLKELAKENIDSAREALIHILQEYRSTTDSELILVFDAYKVRGGRGSTEKHGNIYVVYTNEAESADTYIEKMTYSIKRKYRSRVVTSDVAEQIIIMGNSSTAVTSENFRKEVELADEKIRNMLQEYKSKPRIEFRNRIKLELDIND